MAIENYVSDDFWSTFVDSIDVFDCRLPGVVPGFELATSALQSIEIVLLFQHYYLTV